MTSSAGLGLLRFQNDYNCGRLFWYPVRNIIIWPFLSVVASLFTKTHLNLVSNRYTRAGLTVQDSFHQLSNRIVRGAPDRRSPYFSTIATSHSISQSLYFPPPPPPPRPYPPPFGSNPSSPPPYYPMPSTPSSPLPPFILARAFWTLPVTLPVNHTSISVPRRPPTLVPSFTVSPYPFRPSSILQTSVGPGLLIPSAFYTPPALN